MNTNRIIGYCRDKFITETVEKFKCLDAEQIEILIFRDTCNLESAKRQCKKSLKRIVEEREWLKRERLYKDEPYKYFIEESDQKEHRVLANWMLIHYLITHPYEKIYHIDYQKSYEIMIPDIFLITFNSYTKKFKALFFEMDRTVTNKFDKVEKNNQLYESRPNDKLPYPEIIVANTDKSRLKEINKLISNNKINKNNLIFQTHLIWDIREVCRNEKVKDFRNKFINDTNQLSGGLC